MNENLWKLVHPNQSYPKPQYLSNEEELEGNDLKEIKNLLQYILRLSWEDWEWNEREGFTVLLRIPLTNRRFVLSGTLQDRRPAEAEPSTAKEEIEDSHQFGG